MERKLVFWFSIITFLLCGAYAWGHATHHPQHGDYTQEEVAWMKRQKAVDGTWCCGPENVTLIEDPHYRVRQGRWEVHLVGQWVPVPPGRMYQHRADDPSPFAETFVFFSTNAYGHVTIWCFRTPTGG